MVMGNFLQEAPKFELQRYEKPKSLKELRKSHVPFSGSPQKHPYDPEKVLLVSDPYSSHTSYYEFRVDDISFVEDLVNIVDMDGDTIHMVRVWVKKGSIAINATPFLVEDTWR